MLQFRIMISVSLLAVWLAVGCSKDAPPKPNYGDPALVVEGTEVWQPVSWGGQEQFTRSDKDGDGKLNPAEFTANMRREGLAQRGLKIFRILDTDGDGQLIWDEYRLRPGEATIVSLDVDGNGRLSAEEFGAGKQYLVKINRLQPLFVAWDRDGDGELTSTELESPPFEGLFFERDRDGDDQVSYEETILRAGSNRVAAENDFKYRDRDCNGMLSMRELCYRPRDGKFWAMDTDGNTAVTKKEFKASRYAKRFDDPDAAFAGLDRNGDGRIGVGEFREREPDLSDVFGLAAEPKIGDPKIMFGLLDRNGDGVLVIDEVAPLSPDGPNSAWQEVFDATDVNKNQRVEYEEFSTRGSNYFFVLVDEDRDGKVTKEELRVAVLPWMTKARVQEIFKLANKDEDGTLNADEFGARERRALFLILDSDEDERLTREEYGQNKSSLLIAGTFAGVFDAHDVDGDSALSRAEFDGIKRTSEFASLDCDGDGRLTVGEYSSPAKNVKDRDGRAKWHKDQDANGDRHLSRREFLNKKEFAVFWELDQNGDDEVALSEFKSSERFSRLAAVAETAFQVFDLDRNGTLEVNEYEIRTSGARLMELDRDSNGELTFEEFANVYSGPYYAHKAFSSIDKDSNGVLTATEFAERPEEELLRSPAGALPRVEWAFGFLDSNKDGKLTRDEFLSEPRKTAVGSALGRLFDSAGSDRDGQLSLSGFAGRQSDFSFFTYDEDGDGFLNAEEHYATVPWASKDRAWAIAAALDKNGNGSVDYSEYQRKWGLARFLLEDQNEDGKVEYEEFHGVRAHNKTREVTAREFAVYDRDHDKILTPKEMATTPFGLSFYEKDADGDACLGLDEFVGKDATEQVRQNRTREFGRLDRNADGRLTLRESCFSRTNAKYWRMDRNGDMEVSLDEFAAAPHADTLSRPEAAFQALDLNQDGAFTADEYENRSNDVPAMFGIKPGVYPRDAAGMFERLDLDGDGFVVVGEIVKEGVQAMDRFGKELTAMDRDGDGKVTLDEFGKRSVPFDFPAWDSDRNGSLSLEELRTAEFYWATDSHAAAIVKAIDVDGDGGVSVPEFSGRKKSAPMLLADWDEDGTLSIEEFACQNQDYCDRGQLKLVFETIDRDRDGRLSQAEFIDQPDTVRFLDRDANTDGVIDLEEFCAGTTNAEGIDARKKEFTGKDEDGSGTLTQEEFLARSGT